MANPGGSGGSGGSSGPSMPLDINSYIETAGREIDAWYAREDMRRQAAADDPCRAEVDVRGYLVQTVDPMVVQGYQLASQVKAQGDMAVQRALNQWGRPDSNYIGVDPFSVFVVGSNIITDPLFRGLPLPSAVIEVEGRLPVTSPPKGTRSGSDKGLQVGPGVYLWGGPGKGPVYHRNNGKLRGDMFRETWDAWARNTAQDAAPPARNTWRAKLALLVGSSDWDPGSPASPNSRLGGLDALKARLLAEADDLAGLCADQREYDRTNQPRGLGGGGGSGGGGGGGTEEDSSWTILILLGLAALALRKK